MAMEDLHLGLTDVSIAVRFGQGNNSDSHFYYLVLDALHVGLLLKVT